MKFSRILALLLALCFLMGCTQHPASSSSNPTSSAVSSEPISSGEASSTPPPTGSSSASSSAGSSAEAPSAPSGGNSSPEEPQVPAKQFSFTRDNFPRLNGSTSTVPLGKAIASVLLGETQEEVSDLISFSKTTASYRQLMGGYDDLLIAAEPAAVIWEEKEARGFEWEMEPFAVDGLVFLVNADNPVDSLTTEQVQKIYTGEITNWSQVGGDDLEIVPFQRNAEAGSQTAMLKLVMGDLPMMDAPVEYVQGEMGDLVEAVAAYDGTANAIGYTVYYYANDMKMADGLKIIAIDGVTPCSETIRSGEYPFLNNYYTLIAAGLPEDAPAKVMYNWLLSEEGQRLVAHQGYVSVLDVPDTLPDETEAAASSVQADWSALKTIEVNPLYSYYEPRSEDGLLQPRDDYGVLLAYVGTFSTLDRYILDRMPLYGLVTADGRVVTEPAYASIGFYGDHFLVLMQGDAAGYQESDWGAFRYTVAAADGRWMRQLGFGYEVRLLGKNRLAISLTDGSVVVINADGTTAAEFPRAAFEPYLGEDFRWSWEGGPSLTENNGILTVWEYRDENHPYDQNVCFLDIDTATVSDTPPEGWKPYDYANPPVSSQQPEAPRMPGYRNPSRITDAITGRVYYFALRLDVYRYDLLDETGKLIYPDCSLSKLYIDTTIVRAGLLATADETFFCYRSLETGEVVFRWPIRSNSD